MKQNNPSTRFASEPALSLSKGQALSGLTRVVIGMVITLLVVLFGVGLFIAISRAADYAPVITRTTQPPASPELVEGATAVTADPRVTVMAVTLDGGSLSVTFEAAQISGDILFAPPVLRVGDRPDAKRVEGATPESLKAARLAMLAAITDGKATATLTFADVPPELAPSTGSGQALSEVEWVQRGTLIFNPSSQPGNIVNPRLEVIVEWGE